VRESPAGIPSRMPIRAFPCDSPAVRNLRFGIENFFPFLPHKFDTGRYIFLLYDCPLTRYIPYVSPNPDLIKLYVIKKKSESKDNIGKKALTQKQLLRKETKGNEKVYLYFTGSVLDFLWK
jgi:hypothetical protein